MTRWENWKNVIRNTVEYVWNDKDSVINIHPNEYNGIQHMFYIAKLIPSLLSGSIVDDVHDSRTSRINLVQMF